MITNLFHQFGLEDEILKGLVDMGFEKPTEIQDRAIPYLLNNDRDLIALAHTGTGKTAAFGLPLLNKLEHTQKFTQALILSPTRELCLQICNDLKSFSKYLKKTNIVAVYGGAGIQGQIKNLQRGAQIVVGTPGRTLDLIKRKRLFVDTIKYCVLDEADEMMSMGFQESIQAILKSTPEEKQTVLLSATMPPEIKKIAQGYMHEPHEISVIDKVRSTSNVAHEFVKISGRKRYEALKRLADFHEDMFALVFCRTRRETQEIADKLAKDGYKADCIHGDLSQAQRNSAMNKFKNRTTRLLIATDVAARGIDVESLSYVINYRLPDSLDTYIHRSGRTGRADKSGICLSIIAPSEENRIRQLEKKLKRKFTPKKLPNHQELIGSRLKRYVEAIENAKIQDGLISQLLPELSERLGSFERNELIQRIMTIELNRHTGSSIETEDLNVTKSEEKKGKKKKKQKAIKESVKAKSKYKINVGKEEKLNQGELTTLLKQAISPDLPGLNIVDINQKSSIFQVNQGLDKIILRSLNGMKFRGRKIHVKLVGASPKRSNKSNAFARFSSRKRKKSGR